MYKPIYKNDNQEIEFYNSYYKIKPEHCKTNLYTTTVNKDAVDIYIPTFNSLFCVEYQIKTLRKFYKDNCNIVIVDNNNNLNAEVSNETFNICKKENVTYIKAPDNLFQTPNKFDSSLKLGTTMNWIYLNCVKERNVKYFGYLDQDCFLFQDLSLVNYLDNKNMYGPISKSTKPPFAWNLHVTSNFYKFDHVKDFVLDFRPSHTYQLDTGGANYDLIYKDLNPEDYDLHQQGYRYFEHDIGEKEVTHPNGSVTGTFQYYTIHDSKWIHMCGSTGLASDLKTAYIKGFLDCMMGRTDRSF